MKTLSSKLFFGQGSRHDIRELLPNARKAIEQHFSLTLDRKPHKVVHSSFTFSCAARAASSDSSLFGVTTLSAISPRNPLCVRGVVRLCVCCFAEFHHVVRSVTQRTWQKSIRGPPTPVSDMATSPANPSAWERAVCVHEARSHPSFFFARSQPSTRS